MPWMFFSTHAWKFMESLESYIKCHGTMGLNNTVIMLTVGTKNLIYFTPLKRIVCNMLRGTILWDNKVTQVLIS